VEVFNNLTIGLFGSSSLEKDKLGASVIDLSKDEL